jgi:hypothetical protein
MSSWQEGDLSLSISCTRIYLQSRNSLTENGTRGDCAFTAQLVTARFDRRLKGYQLYLSSGSRTALERPNSASNALRRWHAWDRGGRR